MPKKKKKDYSRPKVDPLDRLVWAVCNYLINEVASNDYRNYLTAVILLGRAEVRKIAIQREKEKEQSD